MLRKMIGFVENGGNGGIERCQLKIVLCNSKPVIWRRVVVSARIPFSRLHKVIQFAMGWKDCHLHQFTAGDERYGPASSELDLKVLDERRYKLLDIGLTPGSGFFYQYDFGDNWEHDISIERVLPPESSFKHSICLVGENACPPEDCGGIHGYYELLGALANPQHEEHESVQRWIGGSWDAGRFDLERANNLLKRLKV
jgi:hypothetical protein